MRRPDVHREQGVEVGVGQVLGRAHRVTERIQHPTAGAFTFDIEIVGAPQEPDQRLVVYTTEVDSSTARLLPILASWGIRAAEAR